MTGSQTTTQTQKSEPWKVAQPYLKTALQGASNLYNQGAGFTPSMSQQTLGGLQGIEDVAGQGNPLNQAATANALGVLQSGGMSPWQSGALGGTYDIATGGRNVGTEGDYRGLLGQASNPYYQQVVDTEAGKLTDDINRGFSGAGRYGSTANTGAIADQVGQFRAAMANANYNQGIANQRGILGDITGVQGQNIANTMGAGGLINQAGNAAQGLAAQYSGLTPTLYDQGYAPSRMLGQAGSAYDAYNYAMGQAPWNRLGAMSGVVGPIAGMGGTATGTQTQPSNFLQTIGSIGASALPFFL